MNRGEVKLTVLFEDDVSLEASYFVLFKNADDRDEFQEAITNLLYRLIEHKEESFEGAVAEVEIQGSDETYLCTYGPLSQEVIEWIREGEYETLH